MTNRDKFDTMLGLEILKAMTGGDPSNGIDSDKIKQSINAIYGKKPTPADGAKAVKELYDAYVQVGFNEVQAFELLKLVLIVKR